MRLASLSRLASWLSKSGCTRVRCAPTATEPRSRWPTCQTLSVDRTTSRQSDEVADIFVRGNENEVSLSPA